MSHWNTFKPPTALTDLNALRSACAELRLPMIGIIEGKKPKARGYANSELECDYVIRCQGPYDVAVQRQADGTLHLTTDWYQGHVERQVGKEYGRLLGLYTLHRMAILARSQGQMTRRTHDAKGNPQIIIG